MAQKAGPKGFAAQRGEQDRETGVAHRIDAVLVPRADEEKRLPAQHRQPHDTAWLAARKSEEGTLATGRGILMRKGTSHIPQHLPVQKARAGSIHLGRVELDFSKSSRQIQR